MGLPGEAELLRTAGRVLTGPERELFEALHQFAAQRFEAADAAAARIQRLLGEGAQAAELQREVHAFLRECWDTLDAIGRQVNICAWRLFPDAGFYPPGRMTRQCTFYTVRRALHASGVASPHPLAALLWEETRSRAHPAYVRLSFLYNVALFAPVPLPHATRFPGTADLPGWLRGLVKVQDVAGVLLTAGTVEVLEWLRDFAGRCYRLMERTLGETPTR